MVNAKDEDHAENKSNKTAGFIGVGFTLGLIFSGVASYGFSQISAHSDASNLKGMAIVYADAHHAEFNLGDSNRESARLAKACFVKAVSHNAYESSLDARFPISSIDMFETDTQTQRTRTDLFQQSIRDCGGEYDMSTLTENLIKSGYPIQRFN
jgi:hypothetical protein